MTERGDKPPEPGPPGPPGPEPAAFRHPSLAEESDMEMLGTKDITVPHLDAAAPSVVLRRAPDGRLLAIKNGVAAPVKVRQLFPWSEPRRHLSLRDNDEAEVALIEDPASLDSESREVLEMALAEAGFVLEVVRVLEIEEEVEIRHWTVDTKQGRRTFQTHLDDWPRVLPSGGRLIRDVAGDLYHLANPSQLDKHSRGLLWAFVD